MGTDEKKSARESSVSTPRSPLPTPHSPFSTRLFLAGYRGTGKTTVAKLLAAQLGWRWIDTDDLVEQAAGKTIAQIFADEGELAFRDLEAVVVASVCEQEQLVVALGGGAILREASRNRIRTAGRVVSLMADARALAERLASDSTTGTRRPNLTATGGLAEIEQVLAERTPIYQQCADRVIDTTNHTPTEVAKQIADWLEEE
ncbi:MAG: shikimate kinase [Planctomycetota bacterium]